MVPLKQRGQNLHLTAAQRNLDFFVLWPEDVSGATHALADSWQKIKAQKQKKEFGIS